MGEIYTAVPWITDHEIQVVEDAMRNGWHENRYNYIEKFQKEFAAYHDPKYGFFEKPSKRRQGYVKISTNFKIAFLLFNWKIITKPN